MKRMHLDLTGKLASSFALAGLIVVLLLLTGLGMWATGEIHTSVRTAEDAANRSNGYAAARLELTQTYLLAHEYMLERNPAFGLSFSRRVVGVERTVRQLASADADDRPWLIGFNRLIAVYARDGKQLRTAVHAGNASLIAQTNQLLARDMKRLGPYLDALVNHEATVARDAFMALNARTSELQRATLLRGGVGGLLIIVFTIIIIANRRQLERTELAVREREQLFRSTFEQSVVGMAHMSLDGQWLRVNNRLCEMFGYSKEQLLACNPTSLMYPDDRLPLQDLFAPVLSGTVATSTGEMRGLTVSDSIFWAHFAINAIRNEGGEPQFLACVVEDISAEKQAETDRLAARAEAAGHERVKALFDTATVGMTTTTIDGRFLEANPAFCAMVDYSEAQLCALTVWDITHPDDIADDRDQVAEAVQGTRGSFEVEKRYVRRDGHLVWAHVDVSPVRNRAGETLYTIAIVQDISQRKLAESELQASENRFRSLIEDLQVGVLLVGSDGIGRSANAAARSLLGLKSAQVPLETHWHALNPYNEAGVRLADETLPCAQVARTGEPVHDMVVGILHPILRRTVWLSLSVLPLFDSIGGVDQVVCTITDVTAQAERTALYAHQALHDRLTSIPNRALFEDRLETHLALSVRENRPLGVVVLDLDGFKRANDTLGHAFGDAVLKETARRLTALLRESDTVARLGGDEFALVLPRTHASGCARLAEKIITAFQTPIKHEGVTAVIGISAGIAVYPVHGTTSALLLAAADRAMYRTKRAGGGYGLYDGGAIPPIQSVSA